MRVLHDYVSRQFCAIWVPKLHDQIIQRDLELCVEMRNTQNIIQALLQLRTATQRFVGSNSFETVLMNLFDLLDKDVQVAYQKVEPLLSGSGSGSSGAVERTKSSELLKDSKAQFIMSSVSLDEEKERVLSASVLPHFRFFGEVMKGILDVCRNNASLLPMYEEATRRAFAFCRKYHRTDEFRHLNQALRNHLSVFLEARPDRNNVRGGLDLASRDTVETLLRIRFDQFNTAMDLGNFSDAYNTLSVEMDRVFNAARVIPDPHNKVKYYAGLAEIFWVSRNRLIHARCLHAMFGHVMQMSAVISDLRRAEQCEQQNQENAAEEVKKSLITAASMKLPTAEELQQAATNSLLAALCTPVVMRKDNDIFNPVVMTEKNHRISKNLGFASFMDREAILASLIKEALPLAADFARKLYDLLESSEFNENVCDDVAKICEWIIAPENKQPETIQRYVPFFKNLAFLRFLQFSAKLNHPLPYSEILAKTGFKSWVLEVQPIVLEFARNNLITVSLDPVKQMVLFPRPANESVKELPLLLKRLSQLALLIDPSLVGPTVSKEQHDARIAAIRENSEKEQQLFAERRIKQEEKAARRSAYQQILKEREEEAKRRQQEEAEAAERERQKKKEEEERLLRKKRLEEQAAAAPQKPVNAWANLSASVMSADGVVGGTVLKDGQDAVLLSSSAKAKENLEATRLAAEKQKEAKAARALEEKVTKMEADAQYLERGKRREENEALRKRMQSDIEKRKNEHDSAYTKLVELRKAEYEKLMAVKQKIDPIRPDMEEFVKLVLSVRQKDVDERMVEYNKRVDAARKEWEEKERKEREEREERERKERKEREEREAREAEQRRLAEEARAREAQERKEREEREAREAQERKEQAEREEKERQEKAKKMREERDQMLEQQKAQAPQAPAKYVPPSKRNADAAADDEGWSRVGAGGRFSRSSDSRDRFRDDDRGRDRDGRDRDGYRRSRDRDGYDRERPPRDDRGSRSDEPERDRRPPEGQSMTQSAYRPPNRRDRDGDYDRDRRDRDGDYGRDRDRGYDRDRDSGYGRDRDRDSGYGRDRDRDSGYGRDRDRDGGYARGRDRDRDRDGSYSRSRDRDGYDRERPPRDDRGNRSYDDRSSRDRPSDDRPPTSQSAYVPPNRRR